MKNTVLWSTLLTTLCTNIYAEAPPPPSAEIPLQTRLPLLIQPTILAQAEHTTQVEALDPHAVPTSGTETSAPPNPPISPQSTLPQTEEKPALLNKSMNTPPASAPLVQKELGIINCTYKIDPNSPVEPSLLLSWAEKAALQTFDFDYKNIDAQLNTLKNCYTDQGWLSYSTALQKSGNIEAIKTQELNVSSIIDGKPQILESKENQWKLKLPLQVVYQNGKEKLTQQLDVTLAVGRKTNGDLGVNQIIATPHSES